MAPAENAWNVDTGNRVSLSKQQFLDCDSSLSECHEDLMIAFRERLRGA